MSVVEADRACDNILTQVERKIMRLEQNRERLVSVGWGYNTIDWGCRNQTPPSTSCSGFSSVSLLHNMYTGLPKKKDISIPAQASLLLLRVEVLLQWHTELFSEGLELLKILLVLTLVLDLGLDAYTDRG